MLRSGRIHVCTRVVAARRPSSKQTLAWTSMSNRSLNIIEPKIPKISTSYYRCDVYTAIGLISGRPEKEMWLVVIAPLAITSSKYAWHIYIP